METSINIAGRKIGRNHSPYIIAEMSSNHNGDINRAIKIIELAKEAGVDAVKLQTYTADTITIKHDANEFHINEGLWEGKTLHELYTASHTPWDWHEKLFNRAKEIGLTLFSSPFDTSAIEFLEELSCSAYKIASFEIVDHELIKKAASTGKPLIISTGIANENEIKEAVDIALGNGCKQLALLHCISGYPTPVNETNLETITDLISTYQLPIGFSDHTQGVISAVVAVAKGASIIEKHITLSSTDQGYDSAFSLGIDEMKQLVNSCRQAWESIGKVDYSTKISEHENIQFRRSLYVVEDIVQGGAINNINVRSIRPGYGISAKHLKDVIGHKVNQDLKFGTALKWEYLD